ncbi:MULTISPECIES: hypothetical protein [unclassified Sphingomonas]|uniref:hypothetical protein n=1 Tax=unclassified Sphingomonas TaxID=196159 RepID=UPI0006F54542|nr:MULTISPECIES: hypothetical protein [unclassified Sphingomonas]KQS51609.1 hypothetical protein ASG20_06375 [Sphingomonas sp. Leaf198]
MPESSIVERLKSIGLTHDRSLEDIHVEDGKSIDLDPRNDRFQGHIERMTFNSIKDVKRAMGIPDEAVEKTDFQTRPQIPTRFALDDRLPLSRRIPPLVLTGAAAQDVQTTKRFYDISAEYVFGDSRRIDQRQIEAIDKWIKDIGIKISIFLFNDIFVGKGSTLNVQSAALFANHITVQKSGRIKFKSGTHSTVHAASFKGL